MRVLHVIPSVAPRYGGPSTAVVGYCRALAARGVSVCIATTNADGGDVLDVPIGALTTYAGVPAIFFNRRGEGFKYSSGLGRWLSASVGKFDIVHIHAVFSHPSLAASRACRRLHVPYVVRPLGSLDPWSLRRSALKKRVLGPSVRAMLSGAAAVHFTTDEERRLAAPVTGSTRAVVIAPGVDDDLVASPRVSMAERERRIVAVARLDPKKRLETVIDAFHRACASGRAGDWTLTIAGDGDAGYRERLQARASTGAGAGRITFPGWLDAAAKRRLLTRASIFVAPSHQENFGLALAEALALGVPAIVTAGVNLAPAIEAAGAGWITGMGEVDLAETLQGAIADAVDRERRSQAARRMAGQFTWSAAAERLDDVYESLLGVAARETA